MGFSSVTVATGSRVSTEFSHGSGSCNVREATYLVLAFSTSVYGLSVRFGHTS